MPGEIKIKTLAIAENVLFGVFHQNTEVRMKNIENAIIEATDVKNKKEVDCVKQKVINMIGNLIKAGILEFR